MQDQIKETEVVGAYGMLGRGKKSVQGFGGKAEGKRPLRRTRHRWGDVIQMDLGEIVWEGVDWIHLD
jgi:hypothetical protein